MTGVEKLTELFIHGEVYADSWSASLRRELNVEDPLADVVAEALNSGHHVALTGNAGDGKSHLIAEAIDRARPCATIEANMTAPDRIPEACRVFIRDASSMSDEVIQLWTNAALDAGARLIVTLNEGPLASLAGMQVDRFYRSLRDVVHARARGLPAADPPNVLLINLAGRQLVSGHFVEKALQRLTPAVVSCPNCDDDTCPKTVGSRLLESIPSARKRLTELLQLLSHAGRRLTARDLWVFLVELFFGPPCPPSATAISRLPNWWFNRAFSPLTSLGSEIATEFDPVHAPDGVADGLLWLGDLSATAMPTGFGIPEPHRVNEYDRDGALAAFSTLKRAWFFLSERVPTSEIVAGQSSVPQYAELLRLAESDPSRAIRRCIALINRFRLRIGEERRLHLSRHHVLTSAVRPKLLASSCDASADQLEVRLPYRTEDHGVTVAGFTPTQLELTWCQADLTSFVIDYRTWQLLQQRRSVYADRAQEALDAGLDVFLGRAPAEPYADPEVVIFDHHSQQASRFYIRGGQETQLELAE